MFLMFHLFFLHMFFLQSLGVKVYKHTVIRFHLSLCQCKLEMAMYISLLATCLCDSLCTSIWDCLQLLIVGINQRLFQMHNDGIQYHMYSLENLYTVYMYFYISSLKSFLVLLCTRLRILLDILLHTK